MFTETLHQRGVPDMPHARTLCTILNLNDRTSKISRTDISPYRHKVQRQELTLLVDNLINNLPDELNELRNIATGKAVTGQKF
jgi:hypothetical protein